MFKKFFKRGKNTRKQVRIAESIRKILDSNSTNLHINLYADNQIIFQVVPTKDYLERGIKENETSGFLELHFFNRNKTVTIEYHSKIENLAKEDKEFIHFEEPNGVNNYIKVIGSDPDQIETVINKRIEEIYDNIDPSKILVELAEYK